MWIWIGNAIVWGIILFQNWEDRKYDQARQPVPDNYDRDLDKLWDNNLDPDADRWEEKSILEMVKKDQSRYKYDPYADPTTAVYPQSIMIEGKSYVPCTDLNSFLRDRNTWKLRGMFNGINLEEGGEELLDIAHFVMLGYAEHSAEVLVWEGNNPFKFSPLC